MYSCKIIGNLLILEPEHRKIELISKPIAGFDLDGTLIKPLPGRSQFDHNPDNWQWLVPLVPECLKLISKDYQIVIITNQGGHSLKQLTEKTTQHSLYIKLTNIAKFLPDPIIIACLGRKSQERKPSIDMWKILNRSSTINCYYVGDAAGRAEDHSDCDLKFSQAIGIPFYLPEDYFNKISKNLSDIVTDDIVTDDIQLFNPIEQEMLILIGYPGCGKTTFANRYMNQYVVLSQDILTETKKTSMSIGNFKSIVIDNLKKGLSIVIDRTNLSKEDRDGWVMIGRSINPKIVIKYIWFNIDLETCYQRNLKRKPLEHIPKIAYYSMRKKYVQPESDGIIKVVDAVKFENDIIDRLEKLGSVNIRLVLDVSKKGDPFRDKIIEQIKKIMPINLVSNTSDRKLLLTKALVDL